MKYGKLINNNLVYFTPYKNGLKLNNHIIYNPSQEQYLEAGWYPIKEIPSNGTDEIIDNVLYHYIGIEKALQMAIDKKVEEINAYDISDNVNVFFLGKRPLWIPRETRVSLQNSTAILLKNGIERASLWQDTTHFELPCTLLLQLLDAIEIYALQCFNKTAEHKANVIKASSLEEVQHYDYTVGYPDKLRFEL